MPYSKNLPPRYLRTPEAGRFVGLSGRTLEKHRTYGTGPRYSKIGGRVVYAIADLQAWCAQAVKSSTSDPGVATVLPAQPWAGARSEASADARTPSCVATPYQSNRR